LLGAGAAGVVVAGVKQEVNQPEAIYDGIV